jgi:hypothetical protein
MRKVLSGLKEVANTGPLCPVSKRTSELELRKIENKTGTVFKTINAHHMHSVKSQDLLREQLTPHWSIRGHYS